MEHIIMHLRQKVSIHSLSAHDEKMISCEKAQSRNYASRCAQAENYLQDHSVIMVLTVSLQNSIQPSNSVVVVLLWERGWDKPEKSYLISFAMSSGFVIVLYASMWCATFKKSLSYPTEKRPPIRSPKTVVSTVLLTGNFSVGGWKEASQSVFWENVG
jgi:hypothetical protein